MQAGLYRVTVAGISAMLLWGCSTTTQQLQPHVTLIEDDTIVSNTPDLANTYIHDPSSRRIVCAQPYPDAAFARSDSSQFSFISLGGSDSGAFADAVEEPELAGRTPTVLITRELFFRLCELSRNHELSKDEVLTLYNKTLDMISEGWGTEAANTTVSVGDTVSNTTQQSIQNSVTGQDQQTQPAATNPEQTTTQPGNDGGGG